MKLFLLIAIVAGASLYVACAFALSSMFSRSPAPPSALLDRPAFRITGAIQSLSGLVTLVSLLYWLIHG